MKVFTKAVDNIYNSHSEAVTPLSNRPYMTNTVFDMPSLSAIIDRHAGKYLLMYDKMSLLFSNIGANNSQMFLSLADGDTITRITRYAGEDHTSTNVNCCGKSIVKKI